MVMPHGSNLRPFQLRVGILVLVAVTLLMIGRKEKRDGLHARCHTVRGASGLHQTGDVFADSKRPRQPRALDAEKRNQPGV